ncbi:shK domain-like domain-containing protein [Ditylenchus destructor]|uniref:ShK domain-like domain-containing protein n=1 Tax=Ditylenchus destructor TaxID=166010 RepID=A0AAD4N437_9BILA|nr:shK domain-like domain-containing protein [Ditylenchus destructor]
MHEALCKNESLQDIMREKCPKTCGICFELTPVNNNETSRNATIPSLPSFHPGFAERLSNTESITSGFWNRRFNKTEISPTDRSIKWTENDNYLLGAPFSRFSKAQQTGNVMPEQTELVNWPLKYGRPDWGHNTVPFAKSGMEIEKQRSKSGFPQNRKCVDESLWECRRKRHLCENKFYTTVMRRNCPRTCGFCGKSARKSHTNQRQAGNGAIRPSNQQIHANSRVAHSNPLPMPPFSPNFPQFKIPKPRPSQFRRKYGNFGVIYPEALPMLINGLQNIHMPYTTSCSNRALDCDEKLHLCTDRNYWKLMRKVCALSCEFCDAVI